MGSDAAGTGVALLSKVTGGHRLTYGQRSYRRTFPVPSNEVQHCRKVHGISIVFVIVHFDELEDCVLTRGLRRGVTTHLTHNTFTNTVIGFVPAGRKPGWFSHHNSFIGSLAGSVKEPL